jgi:hypothetical protein
MSTAWAMPRSAVRELENGNLNQRAQERTASPGISVDDHAILKHDGDGEVVSTFREVARYPSRIAPASVAPRLQLTASVRTGTGPIVLDTRRVGPGPS